MTIRLRLALAFATILALFAVNQGIQFWTARLRTQTVTTLDHALQREILMAAVSKEIGDLHKQMSLLAQVEVEPGQAPAGKDAFTRDVDSAAANIHHLADLTDAADLPAVTELEKTYAKLAEYWKQWYEYLGSEQAFALTYQIMAEPLGRRVVIDIMPALQKQQELRVGEAEARFKSVTRLTEEVGLAIFGLTMIVSGGVAFLLGRYLKTRLDELKQGATAVATMNLQHRITVNSKDELGTVAESFNAMAGSLSVAQEHLTTANRELSARADEIERQRKVSDDLLLNILPQPVAAELAARGEVAPRYFEDVTILFTDFVGFTLSTEKLAAEEVVTVLHQYFKAFDEITVRYGLEKMKTIGDSYFCVGGMPVRTPSHPVDAILAAFEMIHEVERRVLPDGSQWKVRIGLHTGPVVAGVVGTRKFAFDVWGDTVNLGSRMESGGSPNHINVSAAVHQRIKDFFVMESRGRILTKEKKELEMYSVLGVMPNLVTGDEVPPSAFAQRYRTYFDKDLTTFPAFLLAEMHGPTGEGI
jgi:class 3 adenylate cyclase